jgi:hypothetical protein
MSGVILPRPLTFEGRFRYLAIAPSASSLAAIATFLITNFR